MRIYILVLFCIFSYSHHIVAEVPIDEIFYSSKGFDFEGAMKKNSKEILITGKLLLPNECNQTSKAKGVYQYKKIGKEIDLNGIMYNNKQIVLNENDGSFLLSWNEKGEVEGFWSNGKNEWDITIIPIRHNLNNRDYYDRVSAENASLGYTISEKVVSSKERTFFLNVDDKFDVEFARSQYCVGDRYDMFNLDYNEDKKEYILGFRIELSGSAHGDPYSCEVSISDSGEILRKTGECPE